MDFDELNRILDLVKQHELSEFELEREGFKIKIRKGTLSPAQYPAAQTHPVPLAVAAAAPAVPPSAPAAEAKAEAPAAAPDEHDELDLAVVKSPIVGTFFRAPEPGAPPFVEVGALVKKGQVLCIIEAMKLMNEIDSEYDGEVVNVYVENGQPVQYGERLFAIRTR
jgi:acetyl-CoA carboxylase biotin carboxyl carrier protein